MKTINIGILAHVDAGKTTLTEQMLFHCGATRTLGKVDEGTSVSDKLSIERKRGISVKATCVSIEHNGTRINIIDTPGHIDFAGEVERSLCALDAAVLVVSAVEGIQSHTRIIWKALKKLSIPTLFVINKVDRAGSDYSAVLAKIKNEFCEKVCLLNSCEQSRDSFEIRQPDYSHGELIEDMLLAIDDDEVTSDYLEGKVDNVKIVNRFFALSKAGECFGAVVTCAKEGKGIDSLLDGIGRALPDSSYLDKGGQCGVVFKIEHDKAMGICSYIRMFSGEIHNRDSLACSGKEVGKVSQIRVCEGARFVDRGVARPGEIAMVFGLGEVRCGDIIGDKLIDRSYSVSAALMMVSVSPENEDDRPALMKALSELSREDPLLNFEYSSVTGEMYVSITGIIQLEILGDIILDRYGINADFSEPNVIFKETPKIKAVGYESYTMPKPCWAKVELLVEPLPKGSGVEFESVIKDKVMPYRYQHHVELSVMRDCLRQGIYGWEVTDTKITLIGGEYHSIHTHPLDFFVATPVAFLRALQNCKTVLLEPYIRATLSAGEEHLGTVIGNIIGMRGEFDSPIIENGIFSLTAYLPVQDSVFYPSEFSSITSGRGIYFSEFYEYRECPEELYKTLPRIGVDPLDRAKWILYCRSALGDSI